MENTPNKKIKILFADNSKEDLLKITKHFESNPNYEIVGSETDAKQTLDILSNNQVDILVMDIMLGGMDGFEFMEKSKKCSWQQNA
ncbi:MAG: response regulator [Clostridia bacterium]|nr:response regulator [Clostridia bacterium]